MSDPSRASLPERLFVAYFAALPLLWMLGLVLPLALLLVFGILAVFVRDRRALDLAWPWWMVGVCQLISSAFNLVETGQPIWMIARHVLASYVLGWFLFGAAIAVGASGLVRPEALLKSVARIGLYCVSLAVVLYPLAFLQGERYLHVLTPIGRLLPVSLPSTSFFFGMLLYNWEELSGALLPRLSLLFPWTTAMGFGGLCMVLVALNDPERRRCRIGVASGTFMVLASMGRLAAFNLVACVALRSFLAWPRRVQMLALSAAAMLALAVPTVSIVWLGSPLAFREKLEDDFNAMRPSATRSRDLVYEASWDGFYQAPLLGHGWPGEAVYPEDFPQVMQGGGTMVPGSHSTTIGLLYLGGIVTFAAFLFALARTIAIAVRSSASSESRETRRDTIALLAAIGLTGLGEGIYSLVVPTLYAFLWAGIALGGASVAAAPQPVSSLPPGGIALRRFRDTLALQPS